MRMDPPTDTGRSSWVSYVQLIERYLRLDQQMLIDSLRDAGIEITRDARPVFVDNGPRSLTNGGTEDLFPILLDCSRFYLDVWPLHISCRACENSL
jgi:hypothetical protein